MAVRVVNVKPPAAGVDWSFTVPAQWLPYLYGVTATLTTAAALTGFPDETGNGNTAFLNAGTTFYQVGAQGPYAGGANNYGVRRDNADTGTNTGFATTNSMSAVAGAAFTIECVASALQNGGNGFDLAGVTNVAQNFDYFGLSVAGDVADPYNLRQIVGGSGGITIATGAARGTFHAIAMTWDGTTWRWYVDGVLKGSTVTLVPTLPGANFRVHVAGNRAFGVPRGTCGATAFYNAALAAGNLANHAAALGSWTAFRAAALADTPLGLWGLNTIPQGPSRIATLVLSDGTRTLAQYPAAFAAATADSFTWSWQALGPGAQASTDGRINSVPIPELSVAAGYVVSSKTLDLAGTDQWGPITLWFDDGTGPAGGGGDGSGDASYLNALLVPDNYKGSF